MCSLMAVLGTAWRSPRIAIAVMPPWDLCIQSCSSAARAHTGSTGFASLAGCILQSISSRAAFSSSEMLCGCFGACAETCRMDRKAESYRAACGGDLSRQACSILAAHGLRCHCFLLPPICSHPLAAQDHPALPNSTRGCSEWC